MLMAFAFVCLRSMKTCQLLKPVSASQAARIEQLATSGKRHFALRLVRQKCNSREIAAVAAQLEGSSACYHCDSETHL